VVRIGPPRSELRPGAPGAFMLGAPLPGAPMPPGPPPPRESSEAESSRWSGDMCVNCGDGEPRLAFCEGLGVSKGEAGAAGRSCQQLIAAADWRKVVQQIQGTEDERRKVHALRQPVALDALGCASQPRCRFQALRR
jgi:hypothetical protein